MADDDYTGPADPSEAPPFAQTLPPGLLDMPKSAPAYPQGPGAFTPGPQAYAAPEPLPGITSGPAPKPWGLDRTQLPGYTPPASGGSGFITNTLDRVRPYVPNDPNMGTGENGSPDSWAYSNIRHDPGRWDRPNSIRQPEARTPDRPPKWFTTPAASDAST
jgi:hypothetical protein